MIMPGISNLDQLSAKREELFTTLYKKAFPAIAKYVSRMGGSFDEARDVFQDALVVYYEKAASGTLQLQTGEKAYLTGIAKHLWFRKYHSDSKQVPLDGFDVEAEEDAQPSDHKILHFLQTAGKRCMDLLKSFYYDQLPLSDAAALFGFSGVRSATVQKYKCLEKVRETIKEKSLTYEDFLD
jgi:DNA-directed RNA polymerase specialized sigma24 family protein